MRRTTTQAERLRQHGLHIERATLQGLPVLLLALLRDHLTSHAPSSATATPCTPQAAPQVAPVASTSHTGRKTCRAVRPPHRPLRS